VWKFKCLVKTAKTARLAWQQNGTRGRGEQQDIERQQESMIPLFLVTEWVIRMINLSKCFKADMLILKVQIVPAMPLF
jgi:hypothetical protein